MNEQLDEIISFNVNRGLIHEDRWTDLKQSLLQLIKEETNKARIDELEDFDWDWDDKNYVEDRIKELKGDQ